MRVVGEPALGIRSRFIDAALVPPSEDDAGTAGEDEPGHPAVNAAADDVLGPQDVGFVIVLPWSPDTGHSRRVKDNIHAAAGPNDVCQLAYIARHAIDAQ